MRPSFVLHHSPEGCRRDLHYMYRALVPRLRTHRKLEDELMTTSLVDDVLQIGFICHCKHNIGVFLKPLLASLSCSPFFVTRFIQHALFYLNLVLLSCLATVPCLTSYQVAIIGSFSVTLTSFVLPSLMCLACAADSSGLTQAGHKPWMTTPSPTHLPAASPNARSSTSSALAASGNGDGGVGQYGVGGRFELSALVLPPRADSFSPTPHGAPSSSFDSSSAIDHHHQQRHQRLATTNSSFGLLGQQELEVRRMACLE